MKNLKKEIVISRKFQEQLDSLNIYEQLTKKTVTRFKGSVQKVDDELYVLKDTKGHDVCGILDCESFLEALMDTEVAHLWVPKGEKSGLSN